MAAASVSHPVASRPRLASRTLGVLAIAIGLTVGASTSSLQAHLGSPWASLVNAASPWLTPAFLLGLLAARPRPAAVIGLVVCLSELIGYYVTAELRGFPAGHGILVFWGACAVLGGPIFGGAGWAARHGPARFAGLAAATVPAAFLAEAVVAYGIRLHYGSSAALFAAIGFAAATVAAFRSRRPELVAIGLVPVFALGVLAELALGVVYAQTF